MPDHIDLSSRSLAKLFAWLDPLPMPPGGLFLVGGSIRDLLMGRPLKDLDLICRNALAFARLTAETHGACFVPLGRDHDPPSFRVVHAQDHENFLDITELAGPNISADLARRDFTANALALRLDISGPEVIDPFHGADDIRKGLLRHVKPSAFQNDPLRILRGFRLRAQLNWNIEPNTLQTMAAVAPMLAGTAGERAAAELRLILECPAAHQAVGEMMQVGALEVLFPEMSAMRGCAQNRYHHLDVLDHCLAALRNCEAMLAEPTALFKDLTAAVLADLSGWRLPWLKLAVLLHDVGKPGTCGLNPRTGQATFYGHDALGARMAGEAARRLRLSAAQGAFLAGLIRHHLHVGAMLAPQATEKARLRLLRRLGPDVIPATLLCLADTQAARGPANAPDHYQITQEQGIRLILDSLGRAEKILAAPALISGHDLIRLGMEPGPKLGRMLKIVREAQDVGEIKDRQEALRLAKKIVGQISMTPSDASGSRKSGKQL
ncbi:MAG TPA: HD domain-containing protein [Desulfonatronum sp.]|nr:HD domain-containing protein [Desulfonatronum sp.]